jgi:hypothetical protein
MQRNVPHIFINHTAKFEHDSINDVLVIKITANCDGLGLKFKFHQVTKRRQSPKGVYKGLYGG